MDHVPLTPDSPEALLEEVAALHRRSDALEAPWVHPPTAHRLRGWLTYGWDLEPSRWEAHLDDGTVVATSQIGTSEWDNLEFADCGVLVDPDRRREGIGSALLERVLGQVSSQGRTKVGGGAWDGAAGNDFLLAHGFTEASRAINRRQHLAELDHSAVAEAYEEARSQAGDYELMHISGQVPDELIEDLAAVAAAINDAPLDDLDLEDEVFPPQRLRDYEAAVAGRGERLYRLVARHRSTGRLGGHSVVAVEGDVPTIAHQHDTAVAREHRGHRLGLLLKAGMLLWLAEVEPQVTTVDTWNAESNDHMIAVNERLGYRWMGRHRDYQRRV